MQVYSRYFGWVDRLFARIRRGGKPGFPNAVDWAIVALILFSLFMIYGGGGGLAVIAAISIIGLPIAVIMWGAPFLTLVVLPWRMAYLLLRLLLPRTIAALVGLALVFGGLYAIDQSLPRGPHPGVAQLLSHDDPVTRIAPLPEGRIAFVNGNADPSEPAECGSLCRYVLASSYVSEVVLAPQGAAPLSMIERNYNSPCPTGWDEAGRYTCQRPFTGTAPVTLTTTRLKRAELVDDFAPEHRALVETLLADPDRPLKEVTRVTLDDTRSATTTTVHVLRARSAVAGLFGLKTSGIMGEDLTYGPHSETRPFSSLPEFSKDTASSTGIRSLQPRPDDVHVHLLVRALGG